MGFFTFSLIAGLVGLGIAYLTNEEFAKIVNNFISKVFTIMKEYAVKFFEKIKTAYSQVVEWFKGLNLNPDIHVPFISTDPKIGDQIANAAKVSGYGDLFNKGEAYFSGVYNKETGEVVDGRANEIQNLDSETVKAKEGNGYVTLQQ